MSKKTKLFMLILVSALFLGGGAFGYWYFVVQSQENVDAQKLKSEYLAMNDSLAQIDVLIYGEEDAALLTLHKDRKAMYQRKIESIRKQLSGVSAKELTLPSSSPDASEIQSDWMKNLAIVIGIAAAMIIGLGAWIVVAIRKRQAEIEPETEDQEPKRDFHQTLKAMEEAQKRLEAEGKIPSFNTISDVKQNGPSVIIDDEIENSPAPVAPAPISRPSVKHTQVNSVSAPTAVPLVNRPKTEAFAIVPPANSSLPEKKATEVSKEPKPFKSITPSVAEQKRPFSQTGSFILRAEDLGVPPELPTVHTQAPSKNTELLQASFKKPIQTEDEVFSIADAIGSVNESRTQSQPRYETDAYDVVDLIPKFKSEEVVATPPASSSFNRDDEHRNDILKLARRGYTSSEIARRLKLSQDQVDLVIRLARDRGE